MVHCSALLPSMPCVCESLTAHREHVTRQSRAAMLHCNTMHQNLISMRKKLHRAQTQGQTTSSHCMFTPTARMEWQHTIVIQQHWDCLLHTLLNNQESSQQTTSASSMQLPKGPKPHTCVLVCKRTQLQTSTLCKATATYWAHRPKATNLNLRIVRYPCEAKCGCKE